MLHVAYYSIMLSVFCVQSCGAGAAPPIPGVVIDNAQVPSRIRKRPPHFSQEEDNRLCELVAMHGHQSWKRIANGMESSGMGHGRPPRRYRERWHNYLSQQVDKRAWRPEEEERLISLIEEWGQKWVKIGEELQRSGNDVKNHHQLILRRRAKMVRQQNPILRRRSRMVQQQQPDVQQQDSAPAPASASDPAPDPAGNGLSFFSNSGAGFPGFGGTDFDSFFGF
ncbi:MAG: hypothetical protein LBR89_02260 [Holosporales bacterium]|jgi:hypothetical protein|nr:hypothetical protein [Holosporales bacterium]